MDIRQESLKKHYDWQGKIEVISRAPINTREDLSLAYTPGVAEACLKIKDDPNIEMKPQTFIFGAKAAPGYGMAKTIISLIPNFRAALREWT